MVGVGDDDIPWLVKRVQDHPAIPLSEWICSTIYASCDIAVPPWEIATLPNEEKAFASRWEGGTLKDQESRRALTTKGGVSSSQLWKIFAMDYVMANHDRHPGNFLLRVDTRNHKKKRLLAMDFSRALLFPNGTPPLAELPDNCNTVLTARALSALHPFDAQAVDDVLRRAKRIQPETIHQRIDDLPEAWFAITTKTDLYRWFCRDYILRCHLAKRELNRWINP